MVSMSMLDVERLEGIWFEKSVSIDYMSEVLNKALSNDRLVEDVYKILNKTNSKGSLVYVDSDFKLLYKGETLNKLDGFFYEIGANKVDVYDVKNGVYVLI